MIYMYIKNSIGFKIIPGETPTYNCVNHLVEDEGNDMACLMVS